MALGRQAKPGHWSLVTGRGGVTRRGERRVGQVARFYERVVGGREARWTRAQSPGESEGESESESDTASCFFLPRQLRSGGRWVMGGDFRFL